MRPSNPALLAASRSLFEQRTRLVNEWAERLTDHGAGNSQVPTALMLRDLRLMIDIVAEMTGPLRREASEVWARSCDHYGRIAAARGLVAGEVVDEFSALREILTRDLAAGVAALRPRRGLAVLLHLNRVIDRGASVAVAGYTDALVTDIVAREEASAAGSSLEPADVERDILSLELELQTLLSAPAGGM